MFEKLEALRPDLKPMFRRFLRVAPGNVASMRERYPNCPEAYWVFLIERGYGTLGQEDDNAFRFFSGLASAEHEIFQDREIYKHGARGDIMVFGTESMGISYGFDSLANWRLVEAAVDRVVTPLELTFEQFIVGLVLCHPQIAVKVEGDQWFDGTGKRYGLTHGV